MIPRGKRLDVRQSLVGLLVTRRLQAGISQAELATKAKKKKSFIADIETGRRTANAGVVTFLLDIINRDDRIRRGLLLKEWRKQFGMSQSRLAEKLCVKRSEIANIEIGRKKLPDDLAVRCNRLFGRLVNSNAVEINRALTTIDVHAVRRAMGKPL